MSENVRQKAQEIVAQLEEINAGQLPDVPEATNVADADVTARMAELDM